MLFYNFLKKIIRFTKFVLNIFIFQSKYLFQPKFGRCQSKQFYALILITFYENNIEVDTHVDCRVNQFSGNTRIYFIGCTYFNVLSPFSFFPWIHWGIYLLCIGWRMIIWISLKRSVSICWECMCLK